jgi:phosphatidylinositol 4-kinase B
MQSTLKDLITARHDSYSFLVCQRILHKCHEIIFSDLRQNPAPYGALSVPFSSRLRQKKVRPNFEPAVIGIGMMLAGVPSMPALTSIMGEVAIEQGRLNEQGMEFRSIEPEEDDNAAGPSISRPSIDDEEEDTPEHTESQFVDPAPHGMHPRGMSGITASLDSLVLEAAQTVPALPSHFRPSGRPRLSEDPLGQLDGGPMPSPYQSSPAISSARLPPRSASLGYADVLLQSYDNPSQIHLLRSHYCRSEVCCCFLVLVILLIVVSSG